MKYEWDNNKAEQTLKERGLDFVDAPAVLEGTTVEFNDDRQDYGEVRTIAYGKLNGRVLVVVYTKRNEDVTRIISFRKANEREVTFYDNQVS